MKQRCNRRSISLLAKSLGFAGIIGLLGCHADPQAKVAEPPAPKIESNTVSFPSNAPQLSSLLVQPAEARTLAITHLTGRLYWNDEATVRIFTPVAGRVTAIKADLGDAISVNSPLAEINSPDFNMAIANAHTAVGNLAVADKALTRSKELLQHGAAAQKDVEAAEAAYVAALAEKERAEAVLANYGGSEKSTNAIYTLRSPLAGLLVEKNITPGQEVRADLMLANAPNLFSPLFVVSDPSRLWLQLDVSELNVASLEPGQQLRIYSRAYPGKAFDGRLEKIGNSLDPTTRTVKVRGAVDNPDKLLKAEMYVTVDVVADTAKTARSNVEIPAKAVFMKDNEHYLFIEESPGQFARKLVKTGEETDGKTLILDGVVPGQRVVTEGCLLLEALLESTAKS